MNVDGSIRIDTSISTVGFEKGMKKLRESASGALKAVLLGTFAIADGVKGLFSKIADVIGGLLKGLAAGLLIFFAVTAQKIFESIRQAVQDAMVLNPAISKQWEDIKNKFTELRYAVGLAFQPLVEAAIPYLKQTLDWLIKQFNYIGMITAAFLGQKQVLQVIPGSAAKLAKETEKTKKNAQGALAAFDQINVLAKQQDTSGASLSDAPQVAAQMVPITDDILAKVQAIKDLIAAWWNDPIGMIKATWGKIVDWFIANVFQPIANWWQSTWLGQILGKLWDSFKFTWDKLLANTIKTFGDIKDHILQALTGIKEFLVGVFTGDWALAWQGIKDIVTGVFGALVDIVKGSITNWLILFQYLKAQLTPIISAIWDWLKTKALDAWNSVKATWSVVVGWFIATVTNPLKAVFGDALNWIGSAFQTIFSGIKTYVLGVINSIIVIINTMINAITLGLSGLSDLFNTPAPTPAPLGSASGGTSGGGSSGGHGGIPMLATGAVIPPNSQFLAMLGDQTGGTNIEAPAAMFQDMLNQAVAAGGGELTITLPVYLDGEKIYQNQKRIDTRHGKNLRK